MIVVRDLESTEQINDPAIMTLVQQRINDLSKQGFTIEEVGYFVIANSTDTVATIEQHLGVPISAYEIAEEYPSCFDLVYVLNQAGKGIELFVPKEEGIDADLLAMCRRFAYTAPPEGMP